MSAPVRTVFRMSSSAAHRLDCYGQVEVNFFKTGLPLRIIGIKRQVWPKQARRTAEWLTNAGSGRPRTARQLRILSAGAISELRRHQRESAQSPSVFASNVGRRYPAPGFSRLVERAANSADLGIKATCCAMLAATSSPTMATTRARSKPISGIATFRTRRAYTAWAPHRFKEFFRDLISLDRGS